MDGRGEMERVVFPSSSVVGFRLLCYAISGGGVEPVRVSSLWRCSPVEAHPAISREASSVSVIERTLIASYIAYSKIGRIWMEA